MEKDYLHQIFFKEIDYTTIGVPLKFGFKYILTKNICIGIDMQGNINIDNSIYMLLLSIEIGKIKNEPQGYSQ